VAIFDYKEEIILWDSIFMNFSSFTLIDCLRCLQNIYFFSQVSKNYLVNNLTCIFDVTTCFIDALTMSKGLVSTLEIDSDIIEIIKEELEV
jgi:hypothetical protein